MFCAEVFEQQMPSLRLRIRKRIKAARREPPRPGAGNFRVEGNFLLRCIPTGRHPIGMVVLSTNRSGAFLSIARVLDSKPHDPREHRRLGAVNNEIAHRRAAK